MRAVLGMFTEKSRSLLPSLHQTLDLSDGAAHITSAQHAEDQCCLIWASQLWVQQHRGWLGGTPGFSPPRLSGAAERSHRLSPNAGLGEHGSCSGSSAGGNDSELNTMKMLPGRATPLVGPRRLFIREASFPLTKHG